MCSQESIKWKNESKWEREADAIVEAQSEPYWIGLSLPLLALKTEEVATSQKCHSL